MKTILMTELGIAILGVFYRSNITGKRRKKILTQQVSCEIVFDLLAVQGDGNALFF